MLRDSFFLLPHLLRQRYLYLLLLLLLLVQIVGCQRWDIDNPYEQVEWNSYKQYKANFHTHTTISDGQLNPHTVVERYHALGYQVLAITDHNEVTYPWNEFSAMSPSNRTLDRHKKGNLEEKDLTYHDRSPTALGMVDIQANELSRHHHTGSFFNDQNGTETEEASFVSVASKNGVTIFFHPGRYTERNPGTYTIDWYVDFYERFDHLIGMEIYNQGDRYPGDRQTYDSVLTRLMPDRPVWAYSNDDMHTSQTLGRNWNMLLLPELNHASVRKSMESGHSFYLYSPSGHEGPAVPRIEKINVNKFKGIIEIEATGYDSIRWISRGEIIHRGEHLSLRENPVEQYVRAEIFGPGKTVIGTQPFGIR